MINWRLNIGMAMFGDGWKNIASAMHCFSKAVWRTLPPVAVQQFSHGGSYAGESVEDWYILAWWHLYINQPKANMFNQKPPMLGVHHSLFAGLLIGKLHELYCIFFGSLSSRVNCFLVQHAALSIHSYCWFVEPFCWWLIWELSYAGWW